MKATWIVELAKVNELITAEYGSAYFPRRFFYEREAYDLARLIEALGGQARVVKERSGQYPRSRV